MHIDSSLEGSWLWSRCTPALLSCVLWGLGACATPDPDSKPRSADRSGAELEASTPSEQHARGADRHDRDAFVTASGTGLRLNGKPYHFIGANYWQAMNLASKGAGGNRRQFLRELDDMKARGITNLRIVAASEGPDTEPLRIVPALLVSPGVYNEDLLDGLDFAIQALADRDMKAVMTMGNMWHWSGGFGQYLIWTGVATAIPYPPPRPGGDWNEYQRFASQFYGNPRAVAYYLDHLATIVNRYNKYTRRRYRDEPAIMSWELANEPRALTHVVDYLAWIDQSSKFLKSLDRNHLVTTGSEGDDALVHGNRRDPVFSEDVLPALHGCRGQRASCHRKLAGGVVGEQDLAGRIVEGDAGIHRVDDGEGGGRRVEPLGDGHPQVLVCGDEVGPFPALLPGGHEDGDRDDGDRGGQDRRARPLGRGGRPVAAQGVWEDCGKEIAHDGEQQGDDPE